MMNVVTLGLFALCWAILGILVLLQGMKRPSFGWVAFLLLQLPALTTLIFFLSADWSPEATTSGQLQILSQVFGTVMTYAILSSFGLLWRPDRVLGMLSFMLFTANTNYMFGYPIIDEPVNLNGAKFAASSLIVGFYAAWHTLRIDEMTLSISLPAIVGRNEALYAIVGACGACVLTISSIALGGDSRALQSATSDPVTWLAIPALLGAVAGAAVGYIRRK